MVATRPPPGRPPAASPDPDQAAWADGLRLLSGRELSGVQLRQRLERRGHAPAVVEEALARLRDGGALNDRRVAAARARHELLVRGRGRLRALRQIEALGIDPEIARSAVDEVSSEADEIDRIARVLDRRLRHRPPGPLDPATARRLHRYLVAQGFAPGDVLAALRARSRERPAPQESD